MFSKLIILVGAASVLGGCAVVKTTGAIVKTTGKVASLPFKGVIKTGKVTGKGVYKTGKMAGKGAYYTGKGAYKVATVPLKITDAALDTSAKILTVTTQTVNLSGKIISVSRTMQRGQVDAYVGQAQKAANVVGVLVDVFRPG
ncbi:MAG: hypothetical protein V3U57_04750 [Robiginitomaculum sp.]